jgi:hypothetical protein
MAAGSILLGMSGAMASAQEDRIAELERKVEVLTREMERSQLGHVVGPVGEGLYGMSPSASKVYQVEQGLSIGGYGEMVYQGFEASSKSDELDFLRGVVYFGYKYNDQFVFNSEIEFEHASSDKEGSSSVEFATVDYLMRPELNLRAGLMLLPVGIVNELHEPTVFLSATRSAVESAIIPTTWRENGVGAFGSAGTVSYKLYLVNGLNADGFKASGLRGGRQKGSKAVAEDFAVVSRLDWNPTPGLVLGGSAYAGDSGQDLDVTVGTTLFEGHLDWQWKGLELRSLAVVAELDDVAELNGVLAGEDHVDFDSVGERMVGWYVQLGYDLLSGRASGERALTPYVRVEQYDTQDEVPAGFVRSGKHDVEAVTVGINFKPIDEIVLKAEYQFVENEASTLDDQVNLALGYVF